MSYIIYGKRTGKQMNGQLVYDKTFKALKYDGTRTTSLSDAGEYATLADAKQIFNAYCQPQIDAGTALFEIRKSK